MNSTVGVVMTFCIVIVLASINSELAAIATTPNTIAGAIHR